MGGIKYLEAIGQKPKRGRPPVGPMPAKADLVRLYVKEEQSIRDIATALGCSRDAIHRALKSFGIDARLCASRSRLRIIALEDLEAGIKARGARQYAADLGVNPATLYRHLKTRKGQ